MGSGGDILCALLVFLRLTGVPIAYGILTTDTIEQAIERAGTKAGNKGSDAMVTAIEMGNLFNNAGWILQK